jgi:hypothetical protein
MVWTFVGRIISVTIISFAEPFFGIRYWRYTAVLIASLPNSTGALVVFAMFPVVDPAGFVCLSGNGLIQSKIVDYLSAPSHYGYKYLLERLVVGTYNTQLRTAHHLAVSDFRYLQISATGSPITSFLGQKWQ